jgi:hypothetical protein
MTNAYGFSDVGQWWWDGLRAIEEYDWSTPVDAQTTAHIPPSTSHSTLQSSFIMSSLPEQAKEQSEEFKKPVSPLPQAKPVTTLNTDKNLPAVVLSEQDIQDELRVNVSFGSEELSTESDRVDNRLPTLPLATETLPAEVVNDRLGEQQDGTPLELLSNESVSSPVIIYADKLAINNVTVSCRTIRYIAVTQEERDDIDDFHGVDGEQASFNPSNLVIEQWNPLGAQLPPPPPPPPFMVTIPREPMSTDSINTVRVTGEPFTLGAAGMPPSHTFERSSRNIPSNASSHTLSNAPSHTLSNGPSYTVSNPANVERIIHLTSNNAITTPAVAEFLADEAESDAEEEREDLPLAHGVQGVTVDSPKSPRSYSDLLYEFPLRGAIDGSSEPDRLATWKDDGPSDLSAPREHSLGSEHGSQPAIEEEEVEQTPVLEMTAIKRKRIARVLFPQEPSSPKSPQAEISFGAVVIRSSSPVQPSRSRISPQPTPSLYDHASSTEEEQPTKKKTKTVATRKVPAKKRNWLRFGLPNIMKQNINGMGDRTIEQIVEELANERQENSQGSADDAMVDDETSGKELMELAAKSSTETDPQRKVSTKPQSASLSFPDPEAIQGVTNGTEKTINEIFDDFVKETQDKRSIWDDFPTLNPTDFTHHFVDRVEEKRATYSPEAYRAWVEKCRASGERARVERLRVEAENNAKAALEQEEENIERNEDGEEDQEDQEDETAEQQVPQAAALAKEKPKFKSSIAPRRSSRVSATPGPSAAHPTVAPAPVSESDAFSGSDTGSKPEYFDAKPTTRSEMKAFRMQQMNAAIAAEMTPATGKGAKATIPTNLNAKSSKAASTSKAAPAPAKEPKIISKPTTTRASRTKFKGDKKALGVVPADQVDTDESEFEDEFITAPAMAKKAYFKDTESVTGSEDENATTRAPVKKPKVTPKTTNKHAATTKGKGKLSAKETEAVAPNSEDESDSEDEDAALPSVEKKYKDVVKKTKKLLSNTKGESKGKKEVIVIESDSDSDDADEDPDDETKEYIPRLRHKQPSYQPSYVSVDLNSRQKNPFYESWLRRQAHGEAEAREKAKQARDARKRRLSLGADADAGDEEEREEDPPRKKHKTRGASEKEVKGKDAGKKGKGVEEKKGAKGIGNGDAKRKGNGQFAKGDKSKGKRKTL